ncbi:hypothetical protein C8J56DRAFT_879959 [Mycena floridula]|nr:hypothetical protein C8J56DRAFT_879959 [Mycena floridula]
MYYPTRTSVYSSNCDQVPHRFPKSYESPVSTKDMSHEVHNVVKGSWSKESTYRPVAGRRKETKEEDLPAVNEADSGKRVIKALGAREFEIEMMIKHNYMERDSSLGGLDVLSNSLVLEKNPTVRILGIHTVRRQGRPSHRRVKTGTESDLLERNWEEQDDGGTRKNTRLLIKSGNRAGRSLRSPGQYKWCETCFSKLTRRQPSKWASTGLNRPVIRPLTLNLQPRAEWVRDLSDGSVNCRRQGQTAIWERTWQKMADEYDIEVITFQLVTLHISVASLWKKD